MLHYLGLLRYRSSAESHLSVGSNEPPHHRLTLHSLPFTHSLLFFPLFSTLLLHPSVPSRWLAISFSPGKLTLPPPYDLDPRSSSSAGPLITISTTGSFASPPPSQSTLPFAIVHQPTYRTFPTSTVKKLVQIVGCLLSTFDVDQPRPALFSPPGRPRTPRTPSLIEPDRIDHSCHFRVDRPVPPRACLRPTNSALPFQSLIGPVRDIHCIIHNRARSDESVSADLVPKRPASVFVLCDQGRL